MLRQASLPTPDHWAAPDEDSAVSAAESLGYPVVVKAADLDGGAREAPLNAGCDSAE